LQDEKHIRGNIEILRIVATFGIICYHSGIEYGYFGLIVFLIISGFFSGNGQIFSQSLNKRFVRIMIPWLFWSLIYGLKNVARKEPLIDSSNGIVAGILSSPSIHLWYLPYIFILLLFFDQLKLRLPKTALSITCGIISASILVLSPFWRDTSLSFGYPWAQYIHGISAALFGVFLANHKSISASTFISIFVINIGAAIRYLVTKNCGMEYVIAYSAMSFAAVFGESLLISTKSMMFKISQCSFGVYLVHPLVFSVSKKLIHTSEGLLFASLSFALSICTILAAKNIFPKYSKSIF